MTDAGHRFDVHLLEGMKCLQNFDATGHEFSLRYVWVVCVSAFDFYLTELVSEAGLRLIDRTPRILTHNLRQVEVPLGNVLDIDQLGPAERLLFFRQHIFSSIQYKSFYRPEKVSEALSYIWTCPAKEKWARILTRMKVDGGYYHRTEQDIRDELALIGDRRDLIAHAVDISPGTVEPNPVTREDAARVIEFVGDLVSAIDAETESQLAPGGRQ
ncbi:hypothetical protein ACSBOB_27350 [Mesorhizobium sp. ASY16-5R]|uniref:hypothetical protein n=1 Tax=Mesorhizobium sp. ASY16-5R TaxID=3445772 RepID=UPI003FA03B91